MTEYLFGVKSSSGVVIWAYGAKPQLVLTDNSNYTKTIQFKQEDTPESVVKYFKDNNLSRILPNLVWTKIDVQSYTPTTDEIVQALPFFTVFTALWEDEEITLIRSIDDHNGKAIVLNKHGSKSRSTTKGTLEHLRFVREGK